MAYVLGGEILELDLGALGLLDDVVREVGLLGELLAEDDEPLLRGGGFGLVVPSLITAATGISD